MATLADRKYRSEITVLLPTAMTVFVLTVVIGILNGTDIVLFDHQELLAHVHAGTLGWITLSVFASALWLFGGPDDGSPRSRSASLLSHSAAVSVVVYVIVFLTTDGWIRPLIGGVVSAIFTGFFVWVVVQRSLGELSIPQLGFVVALVTSVIGGLLGTAWGVIVASGGDVTPIPEDGVDAHPAMMVLGFLIPVGVAMAEWWLLPERAEHGPSPRRRAGVWQMGLFFVGALLIMLGLLSSVEPLIILSQPFLIAALVIVVVRLWTPAREAVRSLVWAYATASVVFILLDIVYTIVLVSIYEGDFDNAPTRLILALDHLMFIGGLTNAIFALLLAATLGRVSPPVDRIVFAAVNLGIVGFWLGLVVDSSALKQFATPVMGLGILLGLAVAAVRLLEVTRGPALADRGA